MDISQAVEFDFQSGVFWETTGSIALVSVISALAWGLGYFGQPHILTRFMAIRSTAAIPKSRLIAIVCGLVLPLYGAIGVGMVGIAYFGPDNPLNDWEYTSSELYEIVPGFFLASLSIVIISLLDKRPPQEIQDEFDHVKQMP